MENRSIFALHGITGMLIATVLLLSILVVLTMAAIGTQQATAESFYTIENPQDITTFGAAQAASQVVSVEVK
jgi:succinate dehydrogenase/fumarate reductase cytochrome b subunit